MATRRILKRVARALIAMPLFAQGAFALRRFDLRVADMPAPSAGPPPCILYHYFQI